MKTTQTRAPTDSYRAHELVQQWANVLGRWAADLPDDYELTFHVDHGGSSWAEVLIGIPAGDQAEREAAVDLLAHRLRLRHGEHQGAVYRTAGDGWDIHTSIVRGGHRD